MTQPTNPVSTKRKDAVPSTGVLSPTILKKRRVLEERTQALNTPPVSARGPGKASQNVKSSFEEDLNRLTQEITEVGDSTPPSSLSLSLSLCLSFPRSFNLLCASLFF
jgi:hypothetical protein